jgi:hypothetical protein
VKLVLGIPISAMLILAGIVAYCELDQRLRQWRIERRHRARKGWVG